MTPSMSRLPFTVINVVYIVCDHCDVMNVTIALIVSECHVCFQWMPFAVNVMKMDVIRLHHE